MVFFFLGRGPRKPIHAQQHAHAQGPHTLQRAGHAAMGLLEFVAPKITRFIPGKQYSYIGTSEEEARKHGTPLGKQHHYQMQANERQDILRQIQEVMNTPVRAKSSSEMRHYNDLRMLFFNGLTEGHIRNFEDFEYYIRNIARGQIAQADPQLAQIWVKNARTYAEQLKSSFGNEKSPARIKMKQYFIQLSNNALGGNE